MQIITRFALGLFLLASLLLLYPISTSAAPPSCNAAAEGTIVYNKAHKLVQFCNGTDWIGLTAKIGGAGDTLSDLNCQDGEIVKWNGSNWTCAEDSGGLTALQGTDDPGACTPAKDGLIKYNASNDPAWQYCDGGTTSWLPFRLPQCADDDTGACTLAALRTSSDPQFKASSIRCGDKLLGVTGTYGSGSASAFTFTDVTNAAVSTLTTASAVTISGIPAGCPGEVLVSGGGSPQISIAGGAWGTTGSIANGQTLAVRLTSSGSFSTTNTATISIGSTDEEWNVTTLAADTTPNAFTFTDVTNAALSTLTASTSVTINGINTATSVSATGGAEFRINGGTWGTSGTITNGQTLEVRLTSSASFNTALSTTVTVGSATDSWSVTTRAPANCTATSKTWLTNCTATVSAANHGGNGTASITDPGGCGTAYYGSGTFACSDGTFTYSTGTCTQQTACDTTPNAFTFTDVTGANSSTQTTSNSVTISGVNTATPVSATGGAEFRINGGSWVTSGTISNSQTLEVRLTSSASFSTAVSTTVTVGTVSDSWSVTTRAADTAPDAFNFTDLTGVNPSTLSTSTAITPAGYEAGAAVSVTGSGSPQISINGGAWGTSGTITPGQTIAVRLTSSGSFSTALTATVTIGGLTDTWSVTTRAANSCTAASKTWLTNCTATVSAAAHGANGTASITDPGGCGTTWYGSGTFACSDGTFTYSSGTCTQQTACDTTPSAFTFADVTGASPSTLTTATAVSISGINTSTPVSVTGTGAYISINGGSWVTSGTITNGQTLAVRLTSNASFSTAMSATVTVGGVSDTWSVTTRAANNCTVASGTTWTVSSQTCTAPSAVNINHGSTGTSTDSTAPTTGAKTFSCTDGVLATSGTPTCVAAGCSTNANCSSGGKCVGGYCWYLAAGYTDSCTSICASRGGCNTAGTVNYAGSGGSVGNCTNVMRAVISSGVTAYSYPSGYTTANYGLGCHYECEQYGGTCAYIFEPSPATTCGATNQQMIDAYGGYYNGGGRLCACNN